MAIGVNSYGALLDVEALCRVYTDDGRFTLSTIPTRTQTESMIDQVSALVNISLSAQGFTVPVSQADAKRGIDSIVNQLVSDLAHAANSSGRFFTERALTGGLSIWAQVRKEIDEWVGMSATGLAALGADRATESQMTVSFRDEGATNLFVRDQYGSDVQ